MVFYTILRGSGLLHDITGAVGIRHVPRIFDRGGGGGLLASEASKLRQGCGCTAPSGGSLGAGVWRRPLRGVRGAEPPGNF